VIVECDKCHTRYNVDEKKIPATGVKVRCKKCQHVLFIQKEPVTPPEPEVVVEREKEPKIPSPAEQEAPPPPPKPEIPEPPTPVPPDAASTTPPATAAPHEEVSASDLVLYNKEKVEAGLRDGTLVKLLGSEIRRSWEYYCQQVPKRIIESTDYFREQLNRILGKGKEIFK